MLCLAAQSCLSLCNLKDYSPPGSSVHGDSPDKNTGVGCHALLQGIFPTQEWNPGVLHCRQILYSEPPGKPKNTGVVSLSLSHGNFSTQGLIQDLLPSRQILYQLSYAGSPLSTLLEVYHWELWRGAEPPWILSSRLGSLCLYTSKR